MCPHCCGPLPSARHKICASAHCRRARNTEQKARSRAAMTVEERETLRAYDRAWAAAHSDRIKAKNRRAYLADPSAYAAQRDSWRAKNRERHLSITRLTQSRRRAAKRSGDSCAVSAGDWEKIVHRSGGHCFYCGVAADLTMDHVVPLARGGRHAIGNLVASCDFCNKSKGALFVTEWRLRSAMEAELSRRVPNSRLARA